MKSANQSAKRLANLLPGGKIGNKGGTGRPPEWFKGQCREYLDAYDLFGFVARVAKGDDFEQGVGQEGEVIKIPASIKDRLKAVEMIAKWAGMESVQLGVVEDSKFVVLRAA